VTIVIVASGSFHPLDERWLDTAGLVVAADRGAVTLDRLGRRPHRLVGDLDSTPPRLVAALEAAGTVVERHPVDKEASDLELALASALGAVPAAPGGDVVILGATGGSRLDHGAANLLLLTDPVLAGRSVRLVHGPATARILRGGERLALAGLPGDLVSILSIGNDAGGVTTAGLRWPLSDATLSMGRSRGLSNEIVADSAAVSLRDGHLLVVETSQHGARAS
jgi:thiamine pyrophosphokinase